MSGKRASLKRIGAWFGLFLLALDIFLGTAIPVARAAQDMGPIPVADLAICTLDGVHAAPRADDDGQRRTVPAASIFCSACLPLVHLLAAPEPLVLAAPALVSRLRFTPIVQGRAFSVPALGFAARAPPLSV